MNSEIEGIEAEIIKRTEQMLAEKSIDKQIVTLGGIRKLMVAKRELLFKLLK